MPKVLIPKDQPVVRCTDGTEYTTEELLTIIGDLASNGGWDAKEIREFTGADADSAAAAYHIICN